MGASCCSLVAQSRTRCDSGDCDVCWKMKPNSDGDEDYIKWQKLSTASRLDRRSVIQAPAALGKKAELASGRFSTAWQTVAAHKATGMKEKW